MNKKLMVAALLSLVACDIANAVLTEDLFKRGQGERYGVSSKCLTLRCIKQVLYYHCVSCGIA